MYPPSKLKDHSVLQPELGYQLAGRSAGEGLELGSRLKQGTNRVERIALASFPGPAA